MTLLVISMLTLTFNIQLAKTGPGALVAYIEGRTEEIREWFHWDVLGTSKSELKLELRGTESQKRSTVEIVRYEWDFGDGETAEGEYVRHTYYTGNWYLTLTVYDHEGDSASETLKIEVRGERPTQLIESVDMTVYYDSWEYDIKTTTSTRITWHLYDVDKNLVHTYEDPEDAWSTHKVEFSVDISQAGRMATFISRQ